MRPPIILSLATLVLAAGCDGRGAQVSTTGQSGPLAVRHDEHIFAGGLMPPAGSSGNPYRGDRRSAEQGATTFTAMNCDGCHGGGGTGWVGPSLSDGRWRYGGADGELFESIYYGRPRGMPAFGALLPPDAIWNLVSYMQSLEPPANVPTESWR